MSHGASSTEGRRFLITGVVADYPKQPGWNRPGLVEARNQVVDLFTGPLQYHHCDVLPLNPTKQQLTDALNDFCCSPDRREDDLLTVYLSLHGDILDTGGEHVLLTADTDPNRLSYTALRTTDLARAVLQDTKVRRVMLMLDACYGGKGGNQLAATALDRVEAGWSRTWGSGLVVVSSAQPHQQAVAAAFPKLLRSAVTNLSVAGHAPETLSVNAVVQHINNSDERPGHQRISLTLAGLDGEPPAFFPNPRHDVQFNGVDLHVQQAKALDEQDRLRDTELSSRLLIRAMGYHSGADYQAATNPQWWFSGRREALSTISNWLKTPRGPVAPTAQVVTAGPGSGKTAVLGLVAALSHPERRRTVPTHALGLPPGLVPVGSLDTAIYAQRLTDTDVLHALCAAARVHVNSVGALLEALDGRERPLTVLIDALDEAATPDTLCSNILRILLTHSEGRIRLLLGTRPYLLGQLGVPPEEIVDLDDSRYADRQAVTAYAARVLLGSHRASPYRDCPASVRPIAEAVAEAAGRSFLVARLAAFTLASDPTIPPKIGPQWRATLPRHAADAMRQDLHRRLGDDARRATDLLRPLAWAQGQGLPWEDVWAPLASEISGRAYTDEDLLWLRRTAGSYVVEAVEDGRSAYRLYHEAMAEHLRHGTDPSAVHSAYTHVLTDRAPYRSDATRDWNRAHPYALRHLAYHAAEAGLLDALLADPDYLVHASPRGLTPHLRNANDDTATLNAAIYRAHLHVHHDLAPDQRRQVLGLDAAKAGAQDVHHHLIQYLPAEAWTPVWATANSFNTAHLDTLVGHTEAVLAVACTQMDGRPVAVTAGHDQAVRVWSLTTGHPLGEPLTGHTEWVHAVGCTELDGVPIAVTGSSDCTVRVWDLTTGRPLGKPLTGHTKMVSSVACTEVNGRPTAVSTSNDGTVRVWDLATGRPVGEPLTGHTDTVTSVACTELNGVPIAVTGSSDCTVRIWDLTTGRPLGKPLTGHTRGVAVVACTKLDGRPTAITVGWERTVRMWDLTTRRPLGKPLTGHTDTVTSVACTELNGRPTAITGGDDGAVLVWDLATRRPLGIPLTGHTEMVREAACSEVHGRPIAVTGGDDGTVRVWDLATRRPLDKPLTGHSEMVHAVTHTELHGVPVAVTGSSDCTVRVWDLTTGRPVGEPLTGHTGAVYDVACAELRGAPIAVSTSSDGTVRVWDLTTGRLLGKPLTAHNDAVFGVACTEVNGRPTAITTSWDDTTWMWDLATGQPVGEPLTGHTDLVNALACTELDGVPIAVTGSSDCTVRMWDLTTGRPLGKPLTGHTNMVSSVACTELNGRPAAVSTSNDGTVRVWDLTTGRPLGKPLASHSDAGTSVACANLDDHPTAVTGGSDGSVRVWNLGTGSSTAVIFLDSIKDLTLTRSGDIIVASNRDIAVYRRTQLGQA
ncbi:caspase family protein [Streptomyces sp. 24-1644]|uniref:caspase family protein n=1 Tax=Streptomyces sp. 24-1644 TaxID=3457315 RepID=UPI003FA68CA2